MKSIRMIMTLLFCLTIVVNSIGQPDISPDQIQFVRQGVRRFIFDEHQQLPLFSLNPGEIIGLSSMYPVTHFLKDSADITIQHDVLSIASESTTETSVWFGGFNPFATYQLELLHGRGRGYSGFLFTDQNQSTGLSIQIEYHDDKILDVRQQIIIEGDTVSSQSIMIHPREKISFKGQLILQMLGSGLTLYFRQDGLPIPIAQSAFSDILDLRKKQYIQSFQSRLFFHIEQGEVQTTNANASLSSGMGLADIRAITYENGEPYIDQKRLWYTMTIRGRGLPHPLQGVFSMNPSVFDLRLEGVIVFDRGDGLLRNEVASHIFYDRLKKKWRGITTGFSAFADPNEEKQLLAVESELDPRFGFSVMKATPFGVQGDIEDPHILYDSTARKWRMLTCKNQKGYKAIMLESEEWNKHYHQVAGPVTHNSTGTSIQKIGKERYCFSGSEDRKIYIYTYPDLKDAGTLQMDLPPWDQTSGTRVWPNVVPLPSGYPAPFVALMMDRYNFPGLQGPQWTYGALYLYYGYLKGEE